MTVGENYSQWGMLGATFLFANVYLHRKGFRVRRRKP